MPHYVLDARTATPHFPGIGSYCRNLAAALIPLLTTDERLSILYDPSHPINLPAHPGVTLVPLDISPFSFHQQWAIPHIISQLDADVYHSAYYLMPYFPGLPTLVTFYDLIPIRFPQYSTLRARTLFRLAVKLALRTADKGFVISSATRNDMLQYLQADPERLILTSLAPAPQFVPQSEEDVVKIRKKYNLPENFVLYLGSNKPHKNLSRLIQAFVHLRDAGIPLVIAGIWLEQFPESRRLAENLGLVNPWIRWLGPIPEQELPALYTAATTFVFPSLAEGFGLPVVEAMACGTPVVCSRIPSLVEIAGAAAEMFDPTDITSMTTALRSVVQEPDRHKALRQLGLEQAARFSWQKTARNTINQYRDCLA